MTNSIKDYNMQSTGATNKINIDKFVFEKLMMIGFTLFTIMVLKKM